MQQGTQQCSGLGRRATVHQFPRCRRMPTLLRVPCHCTLACHSSLAGAKHSSVPQYTRAARNPHKRTLASDGATHVSAMSIVRIVKTVRICHILDDLPSGRVRHWCPLIKAPRSISSTIVDEATRHDTDDTHCPSKE